MHRQARWGVVAAMALTSFGAASVGAASAAQAAQTLRYYAFNINNGGVGVNNGEPDPGFFAAPGTNPDALSQGDQMIVNDQLTAAHRTGNGYAIVGYDSGDCTLTRVPDPSASTGAQKGPQTLEDCKVTAVLNDGSLVAQGVVPYKADQPEPALLAITGGTGAFDGARGTVSVSFTKDYNIYSIDLK
jgi:hypothetical protein